MNKLLGIIILGLLWFIPVSADHDDTKAWEVDGEYLTPKCFLHEWNSSENFGAFYDRYTRGTEVDTESPAFKKLTKAKKNIILETYPKIYKEWWNNIGLYYGKEIPLEESFEYHDGKLSLTTYLKDCVSSNPITHVMEDGFYEAYHITYDVPKKFCKDFAPNIKSKCLDLKVIFQYKNYRTPFTYHYLYGVFELENKEKIILILKNFHSDEEFDEFKVAIGIEEPEKESENINIDELYNWIKDQTEHNNANALIHDKENRFDNLIESEIPESKVIKFLNNLGGPPNGVNYYENRRYVTTSACKGHECPSKAFVFFDTTEKYTIGLIREYEGDFRIYSKTHKEFKNLPKVFNKAVKEWMEEVGISKKQVFFTGSSEVTIEVTKDF